MVQVHLVEETRLVAAKAPAGFPIHQVYFSTALTEGIVRVEDRIDIVPQENCIAFFQDSFRLRDVEPVEAPDAGFHVDPEFSDLRVAQEERQFPFDVVRPEAAGVADLVGAFEWDDGGFPAAAAGSVQQDRRMVAEALAEKVELFGVDSLKDDFLDAAVLGRKRDEFLGREPGEVQLHPAETDRPDLVEEVVQEGRFALGELPRRAAADVRREVQARLVEGLDGLEGRIPPFGALA